MTKRLQVPNIDILDGLEEDAIFIDVRSPKEYQEFHIPSAMNVPLFSDDERAQVGTLYKQKGEEQAKDLGMSILSTKLPHFYATCKELHRKYPDKPLIIYCWRGGMRSLSLTSVMSMMGLPVFQLIGGIRSFRRVVVSALTDDKRSARRFIVLEGLTGTRKTEILHQLQNEGYPVIDLEGLANHRGSVFGGIGRSPVSQKEFETRLWTRLEEIQDTSYYIIEAESKRVGNVILPDFILTGKDNGDRIHIKADVEFRVDTICRTYSFEAYHQEFREALLVLKKRIPPDVFSNILTSFDQKNYRAFVSGLLEEYYDPRYNYSLAQSSRLEYSMHISSLAEGVDLVKQAISKIKQDVRFKERVNA